jgi:hypothetical protein
MHTTHASAATPPSSQAGYPWTKRMREQLARDDSDARLALGVHSHRLASSTAAMTVALDGLDLLVFIPVICARKIHRRSAGRCPRTIPR